MIANTGSQASKTATVILGQVRSAALSRLLGGCPWRRLHELLDAVGNRDVELVKITGVVAGLVGWSY